MPTCKICNKEAVLSAFDLGILCSECVARVNRYYDASTQNLINEERIGEDFNDMLVTLRAIAHTYIATGNIDVGLSLRALALIVELAKEEIDVKRSAESLFMGMDASIGQ